MSKPVHRETLINFGPTLDIDVPQVCGDDQDAHVSTEAGQYEFFRKMAAKLPRKAMAVLAEATLDELGALELSEAEGHNPPFTKYTPNLFFLPETGDPMDN
jgi:hypothetical protein